MPHRARVVMALRQVGPQLLHGSTEWSCLALPNRSLALGGMSQQQQTLLLRAKKEAVLLRVHLGAGLGHGVRMCSLVRMHVRGLGLRGVVRCRRGGG